MVGDPYESHDDPACYPGTQILRNIPDLRDGNLLQAFEAEKVGIRILEPPPEGDFDTVHYCSLHRHLFQDVYEWAGSYRTVMTLKGSSLFGPWEYIPSEMEKLFVTLQGPNFLSGIDDDTFIRAAADFLADLNIIHPFREGNGRTQLAFLRALGLRAGHPFRSEAVEPTEFLRAMILSYHNQLDALIDELERMRS
jgi:cell filamentation protein